MADYKTKHTEVSGVLNSKAAQAEVLRQQVRDIQKQIDVLNGEIEHARNMKAALEELDTTLKS